MQYAYALNVVDRDRIASDTLGASVHQAPLARPGPCSFADTLALLQHFHMLTQECQSQLLAASYNAAGLVVDDLAIALTCGVHGVMVTS